VTEERKQYIAQYARKCEREGCFQADQLYFWSLEDRLQFIDCFLQPNATVRSRWRCGIHCLYDLCRQSLIPVGKASKTALKVHTFGGYCSGLVWEYYFNILSKDEQASEDPPASKTPYTAKWEGGDDWIVVTANGAVSLGNKKWGRTFPVNQLIARLMWCEGRY